MDYKGTICIIDDDEAVRESLRLLLFVNGYQSQSFDSADAFLASNDQDKFEAILLDLRMPGTDGLELQQILLKRNCRTPIIFISGHGDIPVAVAAIQKGASDFLTKPFEEGALLAKIEVAVASFRDQLRDFEELEGLQSIFARLTARETDVMRLVVQGRSNMQIGDELGISPRTVEIHRAQVMEKMEAGSVAELVKLATLLDPQE
jgi:RNA polymerase sigma factor (sigma-70 family)